MFLDYIDEKLEETIYSFFKLNSIDYGDEKHKFVFPIMSHDPLRVALWNEVENLTVPDSPLPPESLPENHRHGALELQKEREYRKIPQLEFDTPYGIKYSATTTMDDLERGKIRKRNYVKSSEQFKEWYTALIEWTKTLRESSKNHGWTVIDQVFKKSRMDCHRPGAVRRGLEASKKCCDEGHIDIPSCGEY